MRLCGLTALDEDLHRGVDRMGVANRVAMVVRMCDCRRMYLWECSKSDIAESMARAYTSFGASEEHAEYHGKNS